MKPIAIFLLWLSSIGVWAQSPLNRLATCAIQSFGPFPQIQQEIVFIDTDTYQVTKFPFLPGRVCDSLVALDRNGGVWLSDILTLELARFGPSGVLTAFVPNLYRPRALTTTPQGTLLAVSVGVWNWMTNHYGNAFFTSPDPSRAFLQEFAPDGTLLRSLDLASFFPPGAMLPVYSTYQHADILQTPTGHLWIGIPGSTYRGLMRLDPQWNLQVALAVWTSELRPGYGEGVWAVAGQMQGQPAPLGLPVPGPFAEGLVHIDENGVVTKSLGAFDVAWTIQNRIAILPDMTILGMYHGHHPNAGPGSSYPPIIGVRGPNEVGSPVFNPANDITWPVENPYKHFRGFALDGRHQIWALEVAINPLPPQTMDLVCFPATQSPTPVARFPLGLSHHYTPLRGEPTLHTYAMHTDPLGDLDADGIPNRAELLNGTNPFVAQGAPVSLNITLPPFPAAGGWVTLDYTVPGEAGMPYLAPLTFSVDRTSLGSQYLPINLTDPLVSYALQPGLPWLHGTLGWVGPSDNVQVSYYLPPGLPSGPVLYNTLLTADVGLSSLRIVTPGFVVSQ